MPAPPKINEKWFRSDNLWNIRANRIIELLPRGGRLLDMGCYRASQTDMFLARAGSTFGIDRNFSDYSVWLKRKSKTAKADACALPFKDASFETVVLSEVIEHIEDDNAALAEAVRVLKPCGTLIVTAPNHDRINRRILRSFGLNPPSNPEHLREYTLNGLAEKLSGLGLGVREKTGCGFYWFDAVARVLPRLAICVVIKAQKQGNLATKKSPQS